MASDILVRVMPVVAALVVIGVVAEVAVVVVVEAVAEVVTVVEVVIVVEVVVAISAVVVAVAGVAVVAMVCSRCCFYLFRSTAALPQNYMRLSANYNVLTTVNVILTNLALTAYCFLSVINVII